MTDFQDIIGNDVAKTGFVAVLGGIGFEIIRRFFNSKNFSDEQVSLRKELREELEKVKKEVAEFKEEAEFWRDKYYEQVEINSKLQVELTHIRQELKDYKEQISNEFDVIDATTHHKKDMPE